MAVEPGQQLGGWRAPQATAASSPRGRIGYRPVGQQPPVAAVEPGPRVVIDPPAAGGAGPVGDQLGGPRAATFP
jgi:hypothetical protein